MGFNGDLYATSGADVVMTTKGDTVRYDSQRERLGIGSTGQVMTVASSLPTWATLTTADSVLTTQGDVLYESASGLARLGFGTTGDVLTTKGTGANPVWETPSGATTLTKVTKSYTDIDVGSTSMAIYTLPADQALTNVYTDITTVFDKSTAVTIGDAGDPNGFQESTDWTSGTGLSSATRGVYVSTFKGMRSTASTTAILAYGFSTEEAFTQATGGGGDSIRESNRQELAQQFNAGHVLIGENVTACTWFLLRESTPTGTIRAYIKQADGTIKATSGDTVDATSVPETYGTYKFDFASTTIATDDMLTITLDNGTSTGGSLIRVNEDGTANMTDGKVFSNDDTSSPSYVQIDPAQVKMTVLYEGATSDTQGAVDFYLQIAS